MDLNGKLLKTLECKEEQNIDQIWAGLAKMIQDDIGQSK